MNKKYELIESIKKEEAWLRLLDTTYHKVRAIDISFKKNIKIYAVSKQADGDSYNFLVGGSVNDISLPMKIKGIPKEDICIYYDNPIIPETYVYLEMVIKGAINRINEYRKEKIKLTIERIVYLIKYWVLPFTFIGIGLIKIIQSL